MGGISPHLAPCTTTALWKKLGPSGPQSYGFLSLEAGSGGQACGLLPHPALFLGGLSIPRNILKGRGESLDLARTQCQEGAAQPSRPLPSWGTTGLCAESHRWHPGTQDRGKGHLRSSFIRELMSAVSHVHPGEECSICTHESEAAALPGLRATRGTSHTCSPTHILYLSPKERGWAWSLCSKGTSEANVCSMAKGFCFKITTCV